MKPTSEGEEGLVPDFHARYLAEDVPYGLVPIAGLARILKVPTPVMDETIRWAQKRMGKAYMDANGELNGADVGETRCPQRYGFNTLEALGL